MHISGKILHNQPAYRPRMVDTVGYFRFSDDMLEAFVGENVLQEIAFRAVETMPDESIGYLAGRGYRDNQGLYVIVTAGLTAARARRTSASVESTLGDEKEAVRRMESEFPIAEKVGWWHSHPCDMQHYSNTDRENQRLCSSLAYQLGLLVCVEERRITIHAFRGCDSIRLREVYITDRESVRNARSIIVGHTFRPTSKRVIAEIPNSSSDSRPSNHRRTMMLAAAVIGLLALSTSVHALASAVAKAGESIAQQIRRQMRSAENSRQTEGEVPTNDCGSIRAEFDEIQRELVRVKGELESVQKRAAISDSQSEQNKSSVTVQGTDPKEETLQAGESKSNEPSPGP